MAAWAYATMAGLQVLNGLNQASLIRQQAELNKQIADLNIELAQIDQFEAFAAGMTQAARYDNVIKTVESQQEVLYATQGIDASFGTAADIRAESKLNGFLNKLDIENAAYAKAAGIEREISNIRLQSFMSQQQAEINAAATVQTSLINAASTGVSGYMKTNSGGRPDLNRNVGGRDLTGSQELTMGSETSLLTGSSSGGGGLGYLGAQGR